MRKPDLLDAILSLTPNAQVVVRDEEIEWHQPSTPTHTLDEIKTELTRLQTEYNNTMYQRQRAPEYPSIGDQLDALFHAGVFPPEMAAQIQAIKDKYPKG